MLCCHTLVPLLAGEAINPRNVSVVENLLGVSKHYNKQLDREDLYGATFILPTSP